MSDCTLYAVLVGLLLQTLRLIYTVAAYPIAVACIYVLQTERVVIGPSGSIAFPPMHFRLLFLLRANLPT